MTIMNSIFHLKILNQVKAGNKIFSVRIECHGVNVFHTLWITVVWWTAFTFQYRVFSLPSCPSSVYNHIKLLTVGMNKDCRQVGKGKKQLTLYRILWLQSWFSLDAEFHNSAAALSSSTLIVNRNLNLEISTVLSWTALSLQW